jgi:hypothetical protein
MLRSVARFFALLAMLGALPGGAQPGQAVEATNAAGDKILLYPDGRWEYADPARRATMPKAAGGPAAGAAARQTTPGATPRDAAAAAAAVGEAGPTQGGWLFGRRIPPGDPDYDRGSLNPKLR